MILVTLQFVRVIPQGRSKSFQGNRSRIIHSSSVEMRNALCHELLIGLLHVFTYSRGIGYNSRLAVARLGRSPGSRFGLLAGHRSAIRFPVARHADVSLGVTNAKSALRRFAFVTSRGPRLRLSTLTGSVHLADILLQEIAKYARKVFDSPTQSLPGFAWWHSVFRCA